MVKNVWFIAIVFFLILGSGYSVPIKNVKVGNNLVKDSQSQPQKEQVVEEKKTIITYEIRYSNVTRLHTEELVRDVIDATLDNWYMNLPTAEQNLISSLKLQCPKPQSYIVSVMGLCSCVVIISLLINMLLQHILLRQETDRISKNIYRNILDRLDEIEIVEDREVEDRKSLIETEQKEEKEAINDQPSTTNELNDYTDIDELDFEQLEKLLKNEYEKADEQRTNDLTTQRKNGSFGKNILNKLRKVKK